MIAVDRWTPSDGITLEPNALTAATETTRNRILTAGPGAGKTEMLAQCADFLLRTGPVATPGASWPYPSRWTPPGTSRIGSGSVADLPWPPGSTVSRSMGSLSLIDRFRPALTGRDALNPDYEIGERRIQNVSITFKEMVPFAVSIIRASPVARQVVRQTYSHVFLDEFQDCTDEQYGLIQSCFAGTGAVVTAVGDTKQTIMGWAGAMDGVFGMFVGAFDAVPAGLYQNFRAEPALRRMLNSMVRVMEPDAALADDDIVGDGGTVERLDFATDEEEAQGIARSVLGRI